MYLLYGEVAPEGEGEREADADGVQELREVHVAQDTDCLSVAELLGSQRPQHVHVRGERYVLEHDEHVGHGDAGEDAVDGSAGQLLARQHHDVQQVGDGAEHAHCEAGVAVDLAVAGSRLCRDTES